jgi:YD repeat-containing protein
LENRFREPGFRATLVFAGTFRHNFTATYAYDGLNRISTKDYNDNLTGAPTPWVGLYYDQGGSASNANGKLTETFANYVQYNRGYDVMGRVNSSTQYTGGQTFSVSYGYNLASDPTTVTLPTGRVQTTGYDSANRINLVQDTSNGTTSTHASGFSYFPNRVVETLTLGHSNGALNPTVENTALGPRIAKCASSMP